MDGQFLKQEVLDAIKKDPTLYGMVSKALGVAPSSLPRIIYNRDKKLTQAGVLMVLREHLNLNTSEELLEPEIIREDKPTTVFG